MYSLSANAHKVNDSRYFIASASPNPPQKSEQFSMFDSVSITRTFSPNRKLDLSAFKFNGSRTYLSDGWLNVKYSRDFWRYQHVLVEFQVPLALGFSDNLFCQQTQNDIQNALGTVNEKLSAVLGFDCEIAAKSKVGYLDANRDFAVPNKTEYLELIKRLEIPRMNKTPYKTGVMFANQDTQIKCYDKFSQLENRHQELPQYRRNFAETYLRVETRLKDDALTRFLQTAFDSKDRTAEKVLTPRVAEFIVDVSLRKLEMDADLLSFAEWRERVREQFKPSKAVLLIEFVEKINRIGIKRVRGKTKKQINHFDYLRRCLNEKGLGQLVFANDSLVALSKYPNDVWDIYE